VAADPRLCPVGRGSGGRDRGRDEPTPARFLAALDRDCDRARSRVVVLFLRGCGVGEIDGANFIAAMAFQFASTNLVLELGIIIAALIGWQFVRRRVRGGLDNDRAADRHATRRHEPQSDRGSAAS
jgi:hypothetical protein